MHILQVSYTDALGRSFNGFDLARAFAAQGHTTSQAVWIKTDVSDTSWPLSNFAARLFFKFSYFIERCCSLESVLHATPLRLVASTQYRLADIVHYQLIHIPYFNILFLPLLTHLKPTVWSFHDMWPLTGRCVHPFACTGWLEGCPRCPDLTTPFVMAGQGAARMYRIKQRVYERSDFDIIVLSTWLRDRVSRSPLTRSHRTHLVPPGLDTAMFSPGNRMLSRQRLGIPQDRTVIAFREAISVFKGLPSILEALSSLGDRNDIHILTCGETGCVDTLLGRFPVTELGDITTPERMVDFYRASDIFLMPSTAETFGMMAAEAASCGVPCVVFDGTPLPETCFADEGGGIAVAQGDSAALAAAVRTLADDPALRRRVGGRAHELAVSRYDFDRHAEAVMLVYESVLGRRRKGKKNFLHT
ncbi:glycosyl transferase group 1 [Solidesulfovibrio fructosivorans JJ]]|uniref:Glycosyl transferase group 1 n=1 Tax=Solidesulfovibrio fructosivorans JJ] TaxID=596151 RepID=E1JXN7_SOLFR|nr:glycosyltransferase [Solidesulfovibrio fructosivorans]EFL50810.1 glycosyl transferase group 1 [Solidesulfovibrio fructosivorans JJ]]